MDSSGTAGTRLDAKAHLAKLQSLLTLPRETLPRLTAQEAGRYLRGAADRLGLEFVESAGVAPVFLLLPAPGSTPDVTLFQTWHAEALPVAPAAIEGAERLALGAAMAGVEALPGCRVAVVVAPSASAGSRGLDETLRAHRDRLAAKAAYWIRIIDPASPNPPMAQESSSEGARRRVFLGARGRVVIALRGGDGNPYRARDTVVQELRDEAYGPRPLDFELIRKLAGTEGAGDEAGLRAALFDPRGEVVIPPVPHPDRPRAWLTFETAEAMEAERIATRVEALSGGGRAEAVENFPWDRAGIHHPAIHALIAFARERSAGAQIWPSSPWPTPSGLFARALGVGLAEWGIPLPAGTQVRFPGPAEFETLAREVSGLLAAASAERT